ncbi:aldehyde dehydrogenase family protein [Bacillus sp. Marseille-P3661]|uniref:aldehyde dehydrogenase family protein n=1 Tax=Bacillus sp. Marseille-P3661 TaxID=1936234 RepID=UPI000C859D5B|nr:aldehyde dehydrogenase family protein [Bacillus sp. Marseille-P3661]
MSNDSQKLEAFINHREVGSDTYFDVKNPGLFSETVGRVAYNSVSNVDQAVIAANNAFVSWSGLDVKERISLVQTAAARILDDVETLTHTLVKENGTVIREVKTDFPRGIAYVQNTANIVKKFLKPQIVEDEISWMSIEKIPLGVVAIIIPWNSPVNLVMGKLGPALMTGNTVVIKPSPNCPISVSLGLKKMAESLPPGVINVVQGDIEVGRALTEHELVRKISFVGGIETGKAVMKSAASSIKRVSLELGGNDPAILLDDVDIQDRIPDLITGIFSRAGQVCYAVKRVYVPEGIYEKFCDQFCQAVDEFIVGYGLDERATLGPVNNNRQYSHIKSLIERSKQNATVVELGKKLDPSGWNDGYYILPTVIRDVDPTADIVVNEQFGPVIPIIKYSSEEEVVKMANNTKYGLSSSVWSRDRDRALKIARQIEAGSTFINSHSRKSSGPNMPFGGVKESGIGRDRSEIGLANYIDYHSIRYLKELL